jgi:hypothetical protein
LRPPPTASKEDIARAGLELVRRGVLAEYQAAGRVTENCVERVSADFF